MSKVLNGIDVLVHSGFEAVRGGEIGLLVNPASVDRHLTHTVSHFMSGSGFRLKALFGPQHGIYGNTQDNMIEWEGFWDRELPVHSLYGKVREPQDEMLEGIDTMVIDLPDVGARYYTFLWTALLTMRKCFEKGIRVVVLDRPNPINGQSIEGPVLDPEYRSFVGLYPIPVRHGMTMGELLFMIRSLEDLKGKLVVVTAENWRRSMWFDETDLPWVLPSPNMPTPETAAVYPGFCLLEGTSLSEGRGTTRPFEFFGAPYIVPEILERKLKESSVKGYLLRPAFFEPTFQKYKGELCGGGQIHVTDRNSFESVHLAVSALSAVLELWGENFSWKKPPYEYEYEKLPIDILAGSATMRKALESGTSPDEIRRSWIGEENRFRKLRQDFLFYD